MLLIFVVSYRLRLVRNELSIVHLLLLVRSLGMSKLAYFQLKKSQRIQAEQVLLDFLLSECPLSTFQHDSCLHF
jgi:hypothetical protein